MPGICCSLHLIALLAFLPPNSSNWKSNIISSTYVSLGAVICHIIFLLHLENWQLASNILWNVSRFPPLCKLLVVTRIREQSICILGLQIYKCQLTGQAANIGGLELLADQANTAKHEVNKTLVRLTLHSHHVGWMEVLLCVSFMHYFKMFTTIVNVVVAPDKLN